MISANEKRVPAAPDAIGLASQKLGLTLKNWLADFWAKSDGAMLENDVLVYSVEEILERNATYEISVDFPSQVLIGDDSGGRLILMDKSQNPNFYLIDSGNPFLEDAKIFRDFEQLLNEIGKEDEDEDDCGIGNITAVGEGVVASSEIIKLKKLLGLTSSVTDFKKMLEKKDQVIVPSVNFVKYREVIKEFKKVIRFSKT